MKRFEYKILDAAVIEPHRESEEFDLKYEEAREKMLNQYGKKSGCLLRLIHTQSMVLNIFSKEKLK